MTTAIPIFRLLVTLWLSLGIAGPLQAAATLDRVLNRGFISCGIHPSSPGFSIRSQKGWQGFETDFCRAVAAAVLGDSERVRFVPLSDSRGYNELQSGDIDLLMRHNHWSMQQDTALGLTFVAPWFFEQRGFLVQIASQIHQLTELKGIRICVSPDNDKLLTTLGFYVRENHFPSFGIAAKAFENGQCDALSGPVSRLYVARNGFVAVPALEVLADNRSTLQLGPVIRHQDSQWFKIVRWVLYLTLYAETQGISKVSMTNGVESHEVPELTTSFINNAGLYGISLGLKEDWALKVIKQVGNYGEIFEHNLGPYGMPRSINALQVHGGLHLTPTME